MVYRYGMAEAQDEMRVYLLIRNAQIAEIIQVMDELSQELKALTTY